LTRQIGGDRSKTYKQCAAAAYQAVCHNQARAFVRQLLRHRSANACCAAAGRMILPDTISFDHAVNLSGCACTTMLCSSERVFHPRIVA
jgi:hypothetical protein